VGDQEALKIPPVEDPDVDPWVAFPQQTYLPVLPGHKRLAEGGDLEIEIMVR
jgi:hypothetical protein